MTHKEFVKWRAMTDRRLAEITSSLKGVQVSEQCIGTCFSSYVI